MHILHRGPTPLYTISDFLPPQRMYHEYTSGYTPVSPHKYSWAPFETYTNTPTTSSSCRNHRRYSDPTPSYYAPPPAAAPPRHVHFADQEPPNRSFADYFQHYNSREKRSRRHSSSSSSRHQQPVPAPPQPPPQPRHHRRSNSYTYTYTPAPPPPPPPPQPERRKKHRSRHSRDHQPVESVYYLGTPSAVPLFVKQPDTRFRKRESGRASGSDRELPPGKGLRRMKNFFFG